MNVLLRISISLILASLVWSAQAQVFPTTKIKDAGADPERINFVILAEGYQPSEAALFNTDATDISNLAFSQPPLSNYSNFFNVYAIAVASTDSGSDHPATATDEPNPAGTVRNVDTYFDMTFDFANIHRLPYANSLTPVFSVLAANYPGYDQAIVVINESQYGGAGGTIATTSTHPSAGEIAIHEIGHSFADLNDEYWAGTQFARENFNMTAESNPSLAVWSDWVGIGGVSTYPFGNTAPANGWYRPHQSCKMRSLNNPFCPVCSERIIDRIYELVDPIESTFPGSSSQSYSGTDISFGVSTIDPNPNTLKVEWILDGTVVANGTNSFTFGALQATQLNHDLILRVTDETPLSKTFAPASGYVFEEQWMISNAAPLPVEWLSFDVAEAQTYNLVKWSTATESNSDLYIVERKVDNAWVPVSEIEAAKNSTTKQTYSYRDEDIKPGVTYYRIQQRDQDGQVDYSDERTVSRVTRWFYSVYPNPTNGPFALEVYTDRNTAIELTIADVSGKVFASKTIALTEGKNREVINLEGLASGVFYARLVRADGQWEKTISLIKE